MSISTAWGSVGCSPTRWRKQKWPRSLIRRGGISTRCSAPWKRIKAPVPSFSRPLEESLHRAVAYANQRKHEYATLEHLLLSLVDDEEAAGVMRACDVDLNAIKKSLLNYLDTELKSLVVDDGEDAKPTAGFQRVIQRAVIHVQSSGRDE